jgi:hypothetical protein
LSTKGSVQLRQRLQRIGTSNTKLFHAELFFLGRFVDDPCLGFVFPEIAEAFVLQEVSEQMIKMSVRSEKIVIQVRVQLTRKQYDDE